MTIFLSVHCKLKYFSMSFDRFSQTKILDTLQRKIFSYLLQQSLPNFIRSLPNLFIFCAAVLDFCFLEPKLAKTWTFLCKHLFATCIFLEILSWTPFFDHFEVKDACPGRRYGRRRSAFVFRSGQDGILDGMLRRNGLWRNFRWIRCASIWSARKRTHQ